MRTRLEFLSLVVAAGMLSGCTGGKASPEYHPMIAGSARNGRTLMQQYRCGGCHMIPGIAGAHGVFGPPLNQMSRRTFIAGEFPNTPQNLAHWVEAPTAMKPKTAMPDLGLTSDQARDVAAYLEQLQ